MLWYQEASVSEPDQIVSGNACVPHCRPPFSHVAVDYKQSWERSPLLSDPFTGAVAWGFMKNRGIEKRWSAVEHPKYTASRAEWRSAW